MELRVKCPKPFSLAVTVDCGQSFRFKVDGNEVSGIVNKKLIRVRQTEDELVFYNITKEEYDDFFCDYFDLCRDYQKINETIGKEEPLKTIVESEKGIRILNQDPFETLISFIISQNNNIPRIKGIIERLCENFGEEIEGGFAFPAVEKLASLSAEDLAVLRAGFRARYIVDAAHKVASGKVDLYSLKDKSLEDAEAELQKIVGVGKKVTDCTLLFSCRHLDAFPEDVWIKRAVKELFNNGMPKYVEPYRGIAQQYIFNYYRKLHN